MVHVREIKVIRARLGFCDDVALVFPSVVDPTIKISRAQYYYFLLFTCIVIIYHMKMRVVCAQLYTVMCMLLVVDVEVSNCGDCVYWIFSSFFGWSGRPL